ncbi:hypothetical protein B0H13DRAFT_1856083 [Mycena leptocephala]|nr:hypothetical protein B0H13DRAFT_1856083 [Mycena leptocephala]
MPSARAMWTIQLMRRDSLDAPASCREESTEGVNRRLTPRGIISSYLRLSAWNNNSSIEFMLNRILGTSASYTLCLVPLIFGVTVGDSSSVYCQIFVPSSFLYHHLPTTIAQLSATKRAKMPSNHTPDEQALIDSLPTGIVMAFRSSIYQPAYIASNAHLFINNDWIDAIQLREFLKCIKSPHLEYSSSPRPESPPARVKLEHEASDASVTGISATEGVASSGSVPGVKTRVLQEGEREVLEILSDSDLDSDLEDPAARGEHPSDDLGHGTDNARESWAFPSSDIQSDTSYAATDLDGYSSSEDSRMETASELQQSDMLWEDGDISSLVRIGEFRVTKEVTVERVEYLTGFPSLYPIPETSTAFVIDAHNPKFDIKDKDSILHTVDALIKNKDNHSWKGNTGTGDSKVWVKFKLGELQILCCRSRLECKGSYVCERVDERLLDVTRRDLDPASREAVFAAQRQTRREEGTTAERKVTDSPIFAQAPTLPPAFRLARFSTPRSLELHSAARPLCCIASTSFAANSTELDVHIPVEN